MPGLGDGSNLFQYMVELVTQFVMLFFQSFDENPHYALLKELFIQVSII